MDAASVTIKVDESAKQPVSAMAEDFGFGISSIARAFYKQAERGQGIPLSVEYPEPNNESLESIREAEKIIAEKRPGYVTAEEMSDVMGGVANAEGGIHPAVPTGRQNGPSSTFVRPSCPMDQKKLVNQPEMVHSARMARH